MTEQIPGVDPTVAAERHRLRRVRGGGRLVAAPAPLHPVRPHRLLRQLAVPARHRARQGDRPPGDPQLRAGGELVLVLPEPRTSTRRARSSPPRSTTRWTSRCPARPAACPRDWRTQAQLVNVVTRGFRGRRRDGGVKLPPGQYLEHGFPVLPGGPDPAGEHGHLVVHGHHGDRRHAPAGTGSSSPRCPPRTSPPTSTASPSGPSSAPAGAASPSTRCSTASRRTPATSWRAATAATRPTCRCRPARRQGLGRLRVRRQAAAARSTAARPGCSCRTCTSGSPPSGSPAST